MTAHIAWHIPEWTLADRLGKSMRDADFSVQEMADYFEVNRNTIGGWINGRVKPDIESVRQWGVRTGVPYEWLITGEAPSPDGGGNVMHLKGVSKLSRRNATKSSRCTNPGRRPAPIRTLVAA
jgi:transcriptional regulator with XRE-family HTH domain